VTLRRKDIGDVLGDVSYGIVQASSGHSATIAALVFAGADGGVSNNSGYGTRRGSAWVRSPHAYGLGRQTAEKLAEEEGTLDEYEGAVRKVRLLQQLTSRR
jgi:hypothetical protein